MLGILCDEVVNGGLERDYELICPIEAVLLAGARDKQESAARALESALHFITRPKRKVASLYLSARLRALGHAVQQDDKGVFGAVILADGRIGHIVYAVAVRNRAFAGNKTCLESLDVGRGILRNGKNAAGERYDKRKNYA